MNTQDALLSDILDHPEDDGIRRIYADWLDDHGQSDRAEFVRAQLDLAGMEEGDERRPELERRAARLLDRYRAEWLGPAAVEGAEWVFHRGFPDEVEIEAHALRRHGPRMMEAGPVRSVRISKVEKSAVIDRFAPLALDGRIRHLGLAGNALNADDLRAMLASVRLERLESLDLARNPLGTEGVRVLLESPVARQLRRLGLANANLNANSVEALCASEALSRLECLDLSGNFLGEAATPFLAGARHLKALRRLVLDDNRLTPTCARDLAQSPRLRSLRRLSLCHNPLGFDAAVELSRYPALPDLEELLLARTQMSAAAVGQLAPLLGRLRRLDLGGNHLAPSGIEGLLRCKAVPPLEFLGLHGCEIGDDGARALGTWPALATVRELSLGCNGIRAFGLRPLLFSPHLGPVHALGLAGNRLGDMGGQVLARWPGLRNVRSLVLRNSGIGDTGAKELLAAMGPLSLLDLTGCELSDTVAEAFREAEREDRIGTLEID